MDDRRPITIVRPFVTEGIGSGSMIALRGMYSSPADMPTLPLSLPRLLRLDSRAGLTVGVLVLALTPWLHALYGLPRAFLLVSGAANLCYGTCSGWLARQPVHSPPAVMTLVAANALWALVCVAATVAFARSASVIGLLTLWGEALFVGTLAWMEWRALRRVTP